MELVGKVIVGLIAFIHVYIFIFESFLWEKRGPKVFRSFPKELFPKTKALAFNQGVYNLFLAAGLLWSFFINDAIWQNNIALFFLGCIFVAGLAGALTERKIVFIQSVPSLIGILCIVFS